MENTEKLTITAVIPAYNAEKYITRSIDSVLSQTHPVDEIVVVDDGSTDSTPEIIKRYGDKVRYVHQQNAGVSAARNAGVRAATCDWIAFLDADDEWLPDRLMRQVRLLQEHSHLVWVTGNYFTCSCSEKRKAPRVNSADTEKLLKNSNIIEDYFIRNCRGLVGHTATMLIRKDILLETGLFEVKMSKAEDLDLWWKVAHKHPSVGYISEPIAVHHFGNLTSLNKNPLDGSSATSLIIRHQALARRSGTEQSYRCFSTKLLRSWMRGMLFQAQAKDIRQLLREFRNLFPAWYRCLMYGLTVFPKLTRAVLLLISKVVRTLKLRKRVVMPPNK